MEDEDRVIPRVCDVTKLPRGHGATPTLQRQLFSYQKLREDMRSAIEPRLLAANDQAYLSALNRVLTGFGLDRRRLTVAVEPDTSAAPGPKPGALVFSSNLFNWLRRLLGRRGE